MKKISDIKNLKGKRVLLRLDLNVPIVGGTVRDAHRIERSKKTLEFLSKAGAKTLIIAHIESEEKTLMPVYHYLQNIIQVTFAKDLEEATQKVRVIEDGNFVLMENLRNYEGEKKNDEEFAKELARSADYYINEAFSVSHRAHASISAITKFLPSYAGFLFLDEVSNLSSAFSPSHPFLFILGGAKFETKVPLIKRFLNSAEDIFVGGALSNDFYKENGWEVGKSKLSDDRSEVVNLLGEPKIMLPSDVVAFNGQSVRNCPANSLKKDEIIYDSGTGTMHELEEKIKKAKFIVWNGPLGEYEKGFDKATLRLAVVLAEATDRGASTIVGGGDTVAALARLHVEDRLTFVSTGGGAMIDYLGNATLPGIDALNDSIIS